jgi:hypothetical protein
VRPLAVRRRLYEVQSSQTDYVSPETIRAMESESVARLLQDFLSGSSDAVVLEDGAVIFDLSQAKYSVAAGWWKRKSGTICSGS